MTVIHVLPKRFEDFLRHLDCNSPHLGGWRQLVRVRAGEEIGLVRKHGFLYNTHHISNPKEKK